MGVVVAYPRRGIGNTAVVQTNADRLDRQLVCLIADIDELASSGLVPAAAIPALRRLQAGVDHIRTLPTERQAVVWLELEVYVRGALGSLWNAIAAQVGAVP